MGACAGCSTLNYCNRKITKQSAFFLLLPPDFSVLFCFFLAVLHVLLASVYKPQQQLENYLICLTTLPFASAHCLHSDQILCPKPKHFPVTAGDDVRLADG